MSNTATCAAPAEAAAGSSFSDEASDLLRSARPVRTTPAPIAGVVIGRLTGLTESGQPLVDFPANPAGQPVPAATTWPCQKADVGKPVALLFEQGDPAHPVVFGPIITPEAPEAPEPPPPPEPAPVTQDQAGLNECIKVERNGKELVLTAPEQVTLRCGKSSVTLTKAGKVLLRGAYLLSRSSGVNRIKGGSVQIN